MAGDTISVYYGEMLTSPIPLELSFNYCSHGCRFCFANLNKRDRRADIQATMRLLASYRERSSFEAQLLQDGYPVLVSNRVDPFAHSNYQQSVPVMRLMSEMGIPIAVQTRGGRGVEEAMEFLPPSVWYVSIHTLDEVTRKDVEPGAPSIESRFELVQNLVQRGHRVVIGCNPVVREWLPEPAELFARAKSCGAEGAWIEMLHFNYKQVAKMTQADKDKITFPIIERSGQRKRDSADVRHFEMARHDACEAGLAVFSIGQPTRSDFFKPYRELYQKTFPVVQDFVNFAHDTDRLEYWFDDYAEVMLGMPQGVRPYGHVLGATAHQIMRERRLGNNMDAEQFLRLSWNEPQMKQCPARIPCFAYVGYGADAEADSDGMGIMAFRRAGFDSLYFDQEAK